MTRYYYTDPLAAAWMAKHFGFTYVAPDGEPAMGIEGVWLCAELGLTRFYIHPDSVGLLEPREGDVIDMRPDGFCHIFLPDNDYDGLDTQHGDIAEHFTSNATMKGDVPMIETDWKIIQRNGIPFHWPEVEA